MTAALLKFLAAVCAATNAPRPTTRNCRDDPDALRYATPLKDANERRASPLMAEHGFTRTILPDSGDGVKFSSNVYGDLYTHPSGIVVQIYSTFHGKAMFRVTIGGWVDGALVGY